MPPGGDETTPAPPDETTPAPPEETTAPPEETDLPEWLPPAQCLAPAAWHVVAITGDLSYSAGDLFRVFGFGEDTGNGEGVVHTTGPNEQEEFYTFYESDYGTTWTLICTAPVTTAPPEE